MALLSKQTVRDLTILIKHAEQDIRYGEGGTYNLGGGVFEESAIDGKSVKRAQSAIAFIKTLIRISQ